MKVKIKMNKIYDVIIIGSGVAGYTSAIYASRMGLSTILISGDMIGGQLTTTSMVENFPAFPDGISGSELVERMENQAIKYGTTFLNESVKKIIFGDVHTIHCDETILKGLSIIIATGSQPKLPEIHNIHDLIVDGVVSTCALCDGFFYTDMDIAIVGGGDSACEEALQLSNICKSVTLLVRSNKFKASQIMVNRVMTNPKIKVVMESDVTAIQHNHDTNMVIVETITQGEKMDMEFFGLFYSIGTKPNTTFLLDSENGKLNLDGNGFIISENTITNIDGVFVAGDVGDPRYRQAITASGRGCMASIEALAYLQNIK